MKPGSYALRKSRKPDLNANIEFKCAFMSMAFPASGTLDPNVYKATKVLSGDTSGHFLGPTQGGTPRVARRKA